MMFFQGNIVGMTMKEPEYWYFNPHSPPVGLFGDTRINPPGLAPPAGGSRASASAVRVSPNPLTGVKGAAMGFIPFD
jgi:hypothetical protein